MNYINQNKNLKLFIIEPNGNVICSYVEIGDKKEHHKVLLETVKTKLLHNKRLVKKAIKKENAPVELINLLLNNDYILMYDTTNYLNYTKYKNHMGFLMLPKMPCDLSINQKITLLKISKELPLNLTFINYNEKFHLQYVTYSNIDVFYNHGKKSFLEFGNIQELVKTLLEEEKIDTPEINYASYK